MGGSAGDMGGSGGATTSGTPALDAARRMSQGEQLARSARKHPERVAFVCGEDARRFREVDSRVNRLARGLSARGVGQGDRVAVLMGNSIEMIEAIFAGWRLGAIVVPVNFRLVAPDVGYVLDDSGARAVVVDEALLPLVDAVRPSLATLDPVVVLGDPEAGAPADGAARVESYEDVVAAESDDPLEVDVPDQAPALIMYTSGTTGRPKGAVLTHFNVMMQTVNSMIEQGIGATTTSGMPTCRCSTSAGSSASCRT
jgi:fatty-acyl-CoA synthase